MSSLARVCVTLLWWCEGFAWFFSGARWHAGDNGGMWIATFVGLAFLGGRKQIERLHSQPVSVPRRVHHLKSGGIYHVEGEGTLQCSEYPPLDGSRVIIYVSEEDHVRWVRPESEFAKKFERVDDARDS